ncbi:helix-turn-helix domain-containing protein [Acetatifactor muris]|uniref:HTH cro/C1-type domain-containing protein n=1 Tax=Acetatifactor muris TaxID=879566 RepID=A0A2K4ZKD2_9FIRM|nr:helix-turn-helix transcriptional regulator [Acetatifactor muris]MCR2049141.1 helix-turn-helix domain-containing protein [Acetatifactor muris]MCX4304844.1 helix-turn-helix transcriptional regulator [Acetatifactor sp.]SOY30939.1 hypothetical protein AMURIS_03673 [Acetatifactor muris]
MANHKSTTSTSTSISAMDFRGTAISAALNDDLKNTKSISSYLERNEANMIPRSLPEHLRLLLNQKGMRRADVARGSLLDRKYIYQIFDGTKIPSRDKLIAMAFGLRLSAEEAQTMLKLSENRELYVRDRRDAIILFALQRNMSIFETNDLLYEYGYAVLGVPEE